MHGVPPFWHEQFLLSSTALRDPIGILSSVSPPPLSPISPRNVRDGGGFSGRRKSTKSGSRRDSKINASVLLSRGSESEITSEIDVAALRIEKELYFEDA